MVAGQSIADAVGNQTPAKDAAATRYLNLPPDPPKLALPKKWDTPPPMGTLVFYRGQRMWVEPPVAKSFTDSVWVRIGDQRVPTDVRPGGIVALADQRWSFYVHADELTKIDASIRAHAARLPTQASVARAERARAGNRDVGDEVADTLRACADLQAVYAAGAQYLGVPLQELQQKYGHLNHGQQRMNIGNRMRAKWKKEHLV